MGPIIFLAMVNDIKPSSKNSSTFKYVDDLSVVESKNRLPIQVIVNQFPVKSPELRSRDTSNLVTVPIQRIDNDNNNNDKNKSELPSLFLCNARSAVNKFDELSAIIQVHDVDLCAITETWYKHDLPLGLVSIPGYSMFIKSREHRSGGGVALYAKHHLNATSPSNIKVPDNLEVVWAKLRPHRLPRSVSCIFCAAVYFPQPDNLVEAQLVEHLLAAIDDIMTRHPEAVIFITGDFNRLDISALVADPRFKQVVRQATRGDRILDKIICNISDHKEVIICSPIGVPQGTKLGPIIFLAMVNDIKPSSKNSSTFKYVDDLSVVECYSMFIKSREHRSGGGVALYAKHHLNATSPIWKRLKATLKVSIEHAKKEYYASRVQRLKKNNPSAWFRQIRVITGNTKDPNPIQVPDIPSSDEAAIAAAINQSFASVASDIHQLDLAELPSYLPSKSPCPTVSSWEVYKELSKVQQSKAGGPDSISARIIREFCLELATPLADIINTSFSQSKVPSDWKRAIVIR
nr:uncharacterized protein LOC129282765 [Lytechinus pictus]